MVVRSTQTYPLDAASNAHFIAHNITLQSTDINLCEFHQTFCTHHAVYSRCRPSKGEYLYVYQWHTYNAACMQACALADNKHAKPYHSYNMRSLLYSSWVSWSYVRETRTMQTLRACLRSMCMHETYCRARETTPPINCCNSIMMAFSIDLEYNRQKHYLYPACISNIIIVTSIISCQLQLAIESARVQGQFHTHIYPLEAGMKLRSSVKHTEFRIENQSQKCPLVYLTIILCHLYRTLVALHAYTIALDSIKENFDYRSIQANSTIIMVMYMHVPVYIRSQCFGPIASPKIVYNMCLIIM